MSLDLHRLLKPSNWSYRAKVPLLITAISIGTALAISLAIAVSARHWLREDLHDHATAVAQSLARGLVVHMARDDVWEAFEAVRAVATTDSGVQRSDVVVLDRSNRVFVSSDPNRFAVRSDISGLSEPLRRAAALGVQAGDLAITEVESASQTYAVVKMPLLSTDREVIGSLLMSYSHSLFAQRYKETVTTLSLIALALVAFLLPLGWWLGHRLASPVARVTEALYQLGEEAALKSSAYAPAATTASNHAPPVASELARLEHSLEQLQQQLREKEQLQEQFVAADRLAAIGRMTSGVAHEINNPLAGMLNALSNLRKDPRLLPKTVSLLERGLEQIRQTLSALLIETKTTARALSPSDLEDLRVLVAPQARRKHAKLTWHYPIDHELPAPAAPVRQVVLNLLLNAVQASESKIDFDAAVTNSELVMRVTNDGVEFPEARRNRPFEPVVGGEGNGMGLWASYHLVTAMGGHISLTAQGGNTVFEVRIPLCAPPEAKVRPSISSELST
ncbi:sensor histidine kinase [Variovorax sp. GT1P44]|uniref:sensor histidine kinase n=1 Tax=Variovorax sp. GT1P44 TaxID=3443742 RepID=UPI003F45F064